MHLNMLVQICLKEHAVQFIGACKRKIYNVNT